MTNSKNKIFGGKKQIPVRHSGKTNSEKKLPENKL